MNRICDLHTHSVFSDGTDTPAQIIAEAVRLGLSAVALCDHNTVDGLPDFLAAARDKPLDAIPGAEFSVDLEGTELHLLGLFLPQGAFSQISDLMRQVNDRKEQSNIDLVDALNRAGFSLCYDTIKAATPAGKVNRAHIAAALTKAGYTATISDAFRTLLSPAAGYYREPQRLTVWQMLEFLTAIGAVPVLAHPFLNLTKERLAAFLPRAKQAGLAGMECQYSLYDAATTKTSLDLAAEFGLLPSGGSDYHGSNKPDIRLGCGKGNLSVPGQWAQALRPQTR